MRRRRKERGPRGNETGQLTAHRETGVGSLILRYIWVPIYAHIHLHIQTQKAKRGTLNNYERLATWPAKSKQRTKNKEELL